MDRLPAIGGKYAHQHVPVNLRRIIAAESAANDGLAYPFLSISIYLTIEVTKREAFAKWFLVGWLCKCSGPSRYPDPG
jgi:NhaP-type Na+/H+ or K+/H+ antiporter